MRIRTILCYLCVASLAAGLAFATPPPQVRVQVNLVNLFVTVRDKNKSIVTGLKQDDFDVYEDGQKQEISNFSAESDLRLPWACFWIPAGVRLTCSPRRKTRLRISCSA